MKLLTLNSLDIYMSYLNNINLIFISKQSFHWKGKDLNIIEELEEMAIVFIEQLYFSI